MDRKHIVHLLILIILLGIFLRVYNLGKESFWIDEAATAMTVKTYNGNEILRNIYLHGQILPEYYPSVTDLPVYYYTLEYWTRLFSISELSLRFYSVLFGVLTIIFIFCIAKELFGKKTALLSSLLFSISIPAIEFSQEARLYSLYLFLGIASTYYFIKALNNDGNYNWGLYIIFTILALYTQYSFQILLLFQIVYLIFDIIVYKGYSIKNLINKLLGGKEIIKKIFYVYLIIALISSPLIPRTFQEGTAEPWWNKPTLGTTTKILFNFATWIYPSDDARNDIKEGMIFDLNIFDMIVVLSAIIIVISSYLLILYLIYSRLKKSSLKIFIVKEKQIIFLLGWFGFPLVFGLIVSILTPVEIFSSFRYFLFCLPPFIILLSQSILNIKAKYFKVFFVFFIVLNIAPLSAYYLNANNQQWRELGEYMENKVMGDELIIISLSSGEVAFRYYYENNGNVHGVKNLEQTKDLVKGKDRLWLILTFWEYYDPEGSIQKYINENYGVIEKKNFFDIEVFHYQKKV